MFVTIWGSSRLEEKVMEQTYELRVDILKRQSSIIWCYTIGNFVSLICWMCVVFPAWNKNDIPNPTSQPYWFLAIVYFQIIADASAWFVSDWYSKRHKTNINELKKQKSKYDVEYERSRRYKYARKKVTMPSGSRSVGLNPGGAGFEFSDLQSQESEQIGNKKELELMKKEKEKEKHSQDISDPLRREVIAYMTKGVSTGVHGTAASCCCSRTASLHLNRANSRQLGASDLGMPKIGGENQLSYVYTFYIFELIFCFFLLNFFCSKSVSVGSVICKYIRKICFCLCFFYVSVFLIFVAFERIASDLTGFDDTGNINGSRLIGMDRFSSGVSSDTDENEAKLANIDPLDRIEALPTEELFPKSVKVNQKQKEKLKGIMCIYKNIVFCLCFLFSLLQFYFSFFAFVHFLR